MKNHSDKFEQALQSKFNQLEIPYSDKIWNNIQSNITNTPKAKTANLKLGIVTLLTSVLFIATTYYVLDNDLSKEIKNASKEKNNAAQNNEVISNEVSKINTNENSKNEETTLKNVISKNEKEEQLNTLSDNRLEKGLKIQNVADKVFKVENNKSILSKQDNRDYNSESILTIIASVEKTEACVGESIGFNFAQITEPVSVEWFFGDGTKSNDANPNHKYSKSGNYKPYFVAKSLLTNKIFKNRLEEIIIHENPSAKFSWNNLGEQIEFNYDQNYTEIFWIVNNQKYMQRNFKINLPHTTFDARLSVVNEYGCKETYDEQITIKNEFNFLAPTAFTPNGDGNNDTWIPKALLEKDYKFTIHIMDKTGNVVYKFSQINRAWDGFNAHTNQHVKIGETYLWVATVEDENGKKHKGSGSIAVL